MANKESWSTERIALMAEMRARGPKVIWAEINQLPGPQLTRAAVIGKRDRMFGVRKPKKTDEEKAATLKAAREREAAAKRIKRLSNGIGPQVQAINRRLDRVAMHERSGAPEGSLAFKVINGIKKQQSRAAEPGIGPAPFVCQPEPDIVPLRLSLSDLERGDDKCRWPYDALPGESGEGSFRFCGHPVCSRMVLGKPRKSPYCAGHAQIASGKGTESERRAEQFPKGAAA